MKTRMNVNENALEGGVSGEFRSSELKGGSE
jgi:hypothetical protein